MVSEKAGAFTRSSGILLHPTSLPGPFGMGEIGARARAFADDLARGGQSWWQVLPLNAVGGNASPYSANSTFAGNALMVDVDELVALGLLSEAETHPLRALPSDRLDFAAAVPAREAVLALAGGRLARDPAHALAGEFAAFKAKAGPAWLDDYALFEALSKSRQRQLWTDWPEGLRDRDPAALVEARAEQAEAIAAIEALQFLFARQWAALKAHANAAGVGIIGDLAIFVAHDSADVWARPHLFKLDAAGRQTVLAGVPPDYFSATGQLWGNPLYRWEAHAADGFQWWIARMARVMDFADCVRIDHFRGFASCWETPAGETTAINGSWVDAPGHALFEAIATALPHAKVIAEDLGFITDDVHALRDRFAFPGLKILEFEFSNGPPRDEAHPYHYPALTVCYPGTHDNNTVRGWFLNDSRDAGARGDDAAREAAAALELLGGDGSDIHWRFTELALQSGSILAIIALQDVLGLDGSGRMNVPGTVDGNWDWRFCEGELSGEHIDRLAALSAAHGRIMKQ